MRNELELYEFVNDPPQNYFLYINEERDQATTWMGGVLGTVYLGRSYRSNWGDWRVPVWVKGINGQFYQGTYYPDSGNYARVKATKNKPRWDIRCHF
jgi:hypothetical protein